MLRNERAIMRILKFLGYSILATVLVLVWTHLMDFVVVLVGPVLFDTTRDEFKELALHRLELNYLATQFIWNLPMGILACLLLKIIWRKKSSGRLE